MADRDGQPISKKKRNGMAEKIQDSGGYTILERFRNKSYMHTIVAYVWNGAVYRARGSTIWRPPDEYSEEWGEKISILRALRVICHEIKWEREAYRRMCAARDAVNKARRELSAAERELDAIRKRHHRGGTMIDLVPSQ